MGEEHDAPPAVSAHGTFSAVGIEIPHRKVSILAFFKQHESVGTNAKPSPAHAQDCIFVRLKTTIPVVNQDKIVPCTVVFMEFLRHTGLLIYVKYHFHIEHGHIFCYLT
jgi:hypothetical protein